MGLQVFLPDVSITKLAGGGCGIEFRPSKAFNKWHEKASVRTAPRRVIDLEDATLDMFPRNLVPTVKHPIFQQKYLDRISDFLCLQLYRYLNFTINLELLVVNPNLLFLAQRKTNFDFSDNEILALHKMYVDEGYHALFCVDATQQIGTITGVHPRFQTWPSFLLSLKKIEEQVGNKELAGVIFTAVSETLITSNLSSVAHDENIPKAVSKLMMDHAMDEARHHAFFKNLIWKIYRMNPSGWRRALAAVPASIMAFIQPDHETIKLGLMQVGLKREEALQIIDETYSTSSVQEYARYSSRDLVGFMLNNEICDDLHLKDELEHHCLIGE